MCCIVLTVYFMEHHVDEVGACRSGLPRGVRVMVMICDIGAEATLTASFVYPIFSASFPAARLLAIKTSLGSFVTCSASIANYLFSWFHHEHAKLWASFLAGTLPLIVNCSVVYILTTKRETAEDERYKSQPSVTHAKVVSLGSREDDEIASRNSFKAQEKIGQSRGWKILMTACEQIQVTWDSLRLFDILWIFMDTTRRDA